MSVAANPNDERYYTNARPDVIALLPTPVGRVLDVGCGEGGTAAGLRAAGASEIVGIELVPEVAAQARTVFDDVRVGAVEDALADIDGPFDTVLCLDVLEHLVDPSVVLRGLRERTRPGGWLQVSVPNARHFSLVRDLVLKGTFGYGDWGHRDRTHLRWFTPRDIAATVADAGWEVVATGWPPINRSAGLHRLTKGRSSEFLVAQVYVSARNPG
ncbi:MAG: class I SAM-dependent methyltransferase [Solirubrobacteraceae bacterium]|nr:class I SAM-dependent methyltransferase [Solirubrobacteraceae bacterium]